MEYHILTQRSIPTLCLLVNQFIDKGWECLGGIVANDNHFYQAMIRHNFNGEANDNIPNRKVE